MRFVSNTQPWHYLIELFGIEDLYPDDLGLAFLKQRLLIFPLL